MKTLTEFTNFMEEYLDEVNPNHPLQDPSRRRAMANTLRDRRNPSPATRTAMLANDLEDEAHAWGRGDSPGFARTFAAAADRTRGLSAKLTAKQLKRDK